MPDTGSVASNLPNASTKQPSGADLVWRAIGRIQGMNFGRAVMDIAMVRLMAQIKAEKAYLLDGMTWSQFCSAVGISVPHADRQIKAYNELGEELLSALVSVGMGYRELDRVRDLPTCLRPLVEDDAIVIPLVKGERRIPVSTESRGELQLLINDLIAKAESKEQALAKVQRDKERETRYRDEQIDKLADEIEELKSKKGEQTPDQAAAITEAALEQARKAVRSLQKADKQALLASPEAIGKSFDAIKLLRRALSSFEVELGQLMEEDS